MLTVKVENMNSPRTGKPVCNQYIIHNATIETTRDIHDKLTGVAFQSYKSVVAFKAERFDGLDTVIKIYLDKSTWDYSVTTSKYLNEFLNETTKVTQEKIESGEYELVDLNS